MAALIDPRIKALDSLEATSKQIKARARKAKGTVTMTKAEHGKAAKALAALLDKRAIDAFLEKQGKDKL